MEKDLHNLSQIAFQLSVLDIAISSSRDKHTVKSLDIRKDSEGLREENSQKSKQISLCEHHPKDWVSLVAQIVKNRPAVWETRLLSLGQEDPLEK